jgi:hypothetical protein
VAPPHTARNGQEKKNSGKFFHFSHDGKIFGRLSDRTQDWNSKRHGYRKMQKMIEKRE